LWQSDSIAEDMSTRCHSERIRQGWVKNLKQKIKHTPSAEILRAADGLQDDTHFNFDDLENESWREIQIQV